MKALILTIFLSILLCQSSTSSMIGLGAHIRNSDASSLGLGGGTLFSTHSDGFTLSSPSSLWKTQTTRLAVTSSFNQNTNDTGAQDESQIIGRLSFTFPIKETQAVSFGLRPLTRTSYHIRTSLEQAEHISYNGEVFAPLFYYHGSGGISRFFVSYSRKIDEKFSLGVTLNSDFGNLFSADSVFTYAVTTNSETGETSYALSDLTSSKTTRNISGNSIYFEGNYSNGVDQIILGTEFQGSLHIKTESLSPVSGSNKTETENISVQLTSLAGGYRHNFNEFMSGAFELYYRKPFESNYEQFGLNIDDQLSFHCGLVRNFMNQKIGRWDNFNLSLGMYRTQSATSIGDINDFGLTLGLGLEYFNNKNMVDIVLTAGKRNSPFDELTNEKYVNLTIGVSTGETWFIKRRGK